MGRDNEGKKLSHYETYYGSKPQAKARATELEVQFKIKHGPRNKVYTVAQMLELWLDEIKDSVYERTLEKYSWHVKRLVPIVGDLQLFDLSPLELRERLQVITGLSDRTVKDLYSTLRTALNFSASLELVRPDLMRGIKPPKVEHKERMVLRPEELAVFLSNARCYKHYLVIRILAVTGMRTGEVLGLKWRDLDFEKNTLTIVRSADTKHRKLKDTKTKNSKRIIELDDDSMQELKMHRKKLGATNLDDLVFQNGDGRPLRYNAVKRTKDKILVKSGLHHIRLHDLRHGVASILIDQGTPVTLVASTLGQTPSTTANTYSHALRRGKSIANLIGR